MKERGRDGVRDRKSEAVKDGMMDIEGGREGWREG